MSRPYILEDVVRQAESILAPFLNPLLTTEKNIEMVVNLKPKESDYDRVFIPHVSDFAKQTYQDLWGQPPPVTFKSTQKNLKVFALYSDDFLHDESHLNHFPGGCFQVSHLMQPHMVWLAWKFLEPGQNLGMAYDGLVFMGDRFAWFPKPWKILMPYVPLFVPQHKPHILPIQKLN